MKVSKDQHFLVDAEAVALIASAIPVSNRKVLEIGPGKGALTDALLRNGAIVRAIELDRTLLLNLERRFSDHIASGQLEIIHGDASKVLLPEFELVVANLPYSISSKITFRLLETCFESAVLMYQFEFGKRMIAPPGNGEYGRLSVMTQTYADVEMVLELPPEAFFPPPEVRSIVVKITPRGPPVLIQNRSVHDTLVRKLFSHRRKTIKNGLRSMQNIYGESVMTNLVEDLPAKILEIRPEMLSVPDFIDLANRLSTLIS
ncbi:MAG: 16S ribosomal RNA methyltransferase A [Methanocalculaceae archaeon]|jgi:16S rRNA (adenine1518-N6/adenine1519-N6)-dimethyltransferase|nr:16S ribosomal RNA methyltransferase A [Methanocalculaceae archaeon]